MPKKPHFITVRQMECNINDILSAVIQVQSQLEDHGSDRWHQVASCRGNLYEKVRSKWCEITGNRMEDFPFSEDYIAHRLYTSYRKTDLETDNEITGYLELPRNFDKERKAIEKAERRALRNQGN